MAIFRAQLKTVSRKNGSSATAAAAYRSGERVFDEREQRYHDYSRRSGVEHTRLIGWDGTREDLWNAVELAERRMDSWLARDLVIALPDELTSEARISAAEFMAEALHSRYGVAVDVAVHAPNPEGDHRNHHAHLLFTTRRVEAGQLTEKTRELDVRHRSRVEVRWIRSEWEAIGNSVLLQEGHDATLDSRSLEGRGIDREPDVTLGPAATALERAGFATGRGDENRRRRAEANERAQTTKELEIAESAFDRANADYLDLLAAKSRQEAQKLEGAPAEEAAAAERTRTEAIASQRVAQAPSEPNPPAPDPFFADALAKSEVALRVEALAAEAGVRSGRIIDAKNALYRIKKSEAQLARAEAHWRQLMATAYRDPETAIAAYRESELIDPHEASATLRTHPVEFGEIRLARKAGFAGRIGFTEEETALQAARNAANLATAIVDLRNQLDHHRRWIDADGRMLHGAAEITAWLDKELPAQLERSREMSAAGGLVGSRRIAADAIARLPHEQRELFSPEIRDYGKRTQPQLGYGR
jgi:hypothetical protein